MSVFDIEDFIVPKQIDPRGYLYILRDSALPAWIKFGRTTDAVKRLAAYNTDKPFPTCSFSHISPLLEDVIQTEKSIIQALQNRQISSALGKTEWISENDLEHLMEILSKEDFLMYSVDISYKGIALL